LVGILSFCIPIAIISLIVAANTSCDILFTTPDNNCNLQFISFAIFIVTVVLSFLSLFITAFIFLKERVKAADISGSKVNPWRIILTFFWIIFIGVLGLISAMIVL